MVSGGLRRTLELEAGGGAEVPGVRRVRVRDSLGAAITPFWMNFPVRGSSGV